MGALGLVGAVDADDDAAREARLVRDGAREEHAAARLVQQLAGDSAENHLLDPRVLGRTDGEECRVRSLGLLEQRVYGEALEQAELGL